jgi:hypothetical protein
LIENTAGTWRAAKEKEEEEEKHRGEERRGERQLPFSVRGLDLSGFLLFLSFLTHRDIYVCVCIYIYI